MSVVRWGLIGAGDIARKRIAPAFRDLSNCEFAAVSRSRTELAAAFAEEFGASCWYADWVELLRDDEIDAVYIATPVYLHAEQTIAAANAGKHILCEKPMALNVRECDEMIAACRANDVKLGIAYYRHFYPVIDRVKEIIASGEIGKVAVAQINAFEFFDPPQSDPRRWILEKEKSGGGPMIDFGCHRIEIFSNLFGKARQVSGVVSKEALGREVEDTAAAAFSFENGVFATLTVSHASREPQDTLEIFGTNGSIRIPVLNTGELIVRLGSEERKESHPPAANIHQPLIDDFADCILNDRPPTVSGEDGRTVAEMIETIYE
jgi:predicted dehydrogenase